MNMDTYSKPTPQCFMPACRGVSFDGLRRVRDTLQDIPRSLSSQFGIGALSEEEKSDEQNLTGIVRGDGNYHFTLSAQRADRADGGGLIVASAQRTPGGLPVALKCRWSRRSGDMSIELPGVTTDVYQVTADDIGARICVEVWPLDSDDGLYGRSTGEIGPFELDAPTRRRLDNYLGLGSCSFNVFINESTSTLAESPSTPFSSSSSSGKFRQESVIHCSKDEVRVVPVLNGNPGPVMGRILTTEISTRYSGSFPRVQLHILDVTQFRIALDADRVLNVVAPSRATRDLIALMVRCFQALRCAPIERALEGILPAMRASPRPVGSVHSLGCQIDSATAAAAAFGASVGGSSTADWLDNCIRLSSLMAASRGALQQLETTEKILRNAKREKEQLQKQMQESIDGCTEVIVGLQEEFATKNIPSSPSKLSAMPSVKQLQEQVKAVTSMNHQAFLEVNDLKDQLEKLHRTREAAHTMIKPLREERDLARAKWQELHLSAATQQLDQAGQDHAREVKRLRREVEELHIEKEELREKLQDFDAERDDLSTNFVFVKAQLDKCRQRQSEEADEDGSKAVQKHRKILTTVQQEKVQMSARLGNVVREVEREKVYHEQQINRVMSANARLLEERDRAAAEVQRLSKVYAECIGQLRNDGHVVDESENVVVPLRCAAGKTICDVDPGEVQKLRQQLASVETALQQRERENETLRVRLRKLAAQ
eukprot:TRINITY_DN36034_c0_g1_i1.p1 TRINITY_DN36034_c0_g1~~TRINITY_DN36034_c0_g1_i1.p1  ORF type:complete len:714 (+),score=146.87 TRINITY_DN36034_c0_g1_i1:288-2429(+)